MCADVYINVYNYNNTNNKWYTICLSMYFTEFVAATDFVVIIRSLQLKLIKKFILFLPKTILR